MTRPDRASTVQDALLRARDALAALLREFPQTGARVGELLAILGDLERAAGKDVPEDGSRAEARASVRSGRKPKQYTVETVGTDEFLAEYRAGNPRPFRAPRTVFDAVVKVLAKAKHPLQASEIREGVGRNLGAIPPEYAIRLCLRFLCSKPVSLVNRHRARYAATHRHRLAVAAAEAFPSVKEPETRGARRSRR